MDQRAQRFSKGTLQGQPLLHLLISSASFDSKWHEDFTFTSCHFSINSVASSGGPCDKRPSGHHSSVTLPWGVNRAAEQHMWSTLLFHWKGVAQGQRSGWMQLLWSEVGRRPPDRGRKKRWRSLGNGGCFRMFTQHCSCRKHLVSSLQRRLLPLKRNSAEAFLIIRLLDGDRPKIRALNLNAFVLEETEGIWHLNAYVWVHTHSWDRNKK